MGFFTGAFDKSVFNKGSYQAAIGDDKSNGYAVVKIKPKFPRIYDTEEDPPIKGVLDMSEGGFSFDIDSNWQDFAGIATSVLPVTSKVQNFYNTVNGIANVAGFSDIGAAYSSKKIYQKSDYMTIKIPMMVVDWSGEGQPVLCAMLLSYYVLPLTIGTGTQFIDAALDELKNYLYAKKQYDILNVIESSQYNAREGIKFVKNFLNQNADTIRNNVPGNQIFERLGQTTFEDLDDLITLRASPSPVIVEIGNFFKHDDMIITNVNFSFSKEMTKNGPLYVKFNLSLSTRKILTKLSDVGLLTPNSDGTNSRFLQANFTG